MNPLWGGTDFGPRSFPPAIKKRDKKWNDNEFCTKQRKPKKSLDNLKINPDNDEDEKNVSVN